MEWISVEDKLPEGDCLVWVEDDGHAGCRFHIANCHKSVTVVGNHFSFDMPKITHWQPLPEEPKGKE